jgi:hypothetical protein
LVAQEDAPEREQEHVLLDETSLGDATQPRRLLFRLAALLMLLLAGIPQPAYADGIPVAIEGVSEFDIEMPAQKAILVYDEQSQREDLILSVELRGGPEAAWVVPVPSLPEVETDSPEWFEQPSDMTKPKIEHLGRPPDGHTGGSWLQDLVCR